MSIDFKLIGSRIKTTRKKAGRTQEWLAEQIDVSVGYISQIERGDYSPSVTLALKLAKLCNVTVEDIFEYEEDNGEDNNGFNSIQN